MLQYFVVMFTGPKDTVPTPPLIALLMDFQTTAVYHHGNRLLKSFSSKYQNVFLPPFLVFLPSSFLHSIYSLQASFLPFFLSHLIHLITCLLSFELKLSINFSHKILHISDSIGNLGSMGWEVTVSLLFSWILVYLCLMKGVKSSGKVRHVIFCLSPLAISCHCLIAFFTQLGLCLLSVRLFPPSISQVAKLRTFFT